MRLVLLGARRLAVAAVTLLVSSFVIYSALFVGPGNPISALSGGRSLSPSSVAALRARYQLDEPYLVRYWNWLTGAVHGDLGYSIAQQQSVASLITARLPVTVALLASAAVLTVVFGVGLGALGSLRPGGIDAGVLALTAVSAAVPAFVAAIVLILVFAVNLEWLPAFGDGSGGSIVEQIRHLILPAVALAISGFSLVARVTRTAMREELSREHVETAISRGIARRAIVRRHVARNAAIPILTVAGVVIATLIALDTVVESAFSLDGLGSYLVQSALTKDMAVVQGICLVLITTFVVLNTLVDLTYVLLDPRLKRRRAAT